MLVWNSSPKECSHKLTHFCFFKHQLDSPQGLGAVPFPNHFGTVKHKSWGVEALEAESYDLGTRCKLLRVSARFLFFFFFFFPKTVELRFSVFKHLTACPGVLGRMLEINNSDRTSLHHKVSEPLNAYLHFRHSILCRH